MLNFRNRFLFFRRFLLSTLAMSFVGQQDLRAGTPLLVSRVVGEVGTKVVTSREVKINYILEKLVFEKDEKAACSNDLEMDSKPFSDFLVVVFNEWVIFLESMAFRKDGERALKESSAVLPEKVNIEGCFALKKLEPSQAELSAILTRKSTVKDFLQIKTNSSLITISDDDAMDYYKKNRIKFGGLPFSNFSENIKAFLTKQQAERRLVEWLKVLYRKYDVKNEMGD